MGRWICNNVRCIMIRYSTYICIFVVTTVNSILLKRIHASWKCKILGQTESMYGTFSAYKFQLFFFVYLMAIFTFDKGRYCCILMLIYRKSMVFLASTNKAYFCKLVVITDEIFCTYSHQKWKISIHTFDSKYLWRQAHKNMPLMVFSSHIKLIHSGIV